MNGRNGTAVALTMVLEGLGYSIYGAIFGVYLFELKASFTELALLTAIPNATALFLSRFWGIISDESHARKPFILWGKYVAAFFVFIYSLTTNVKEILILFILASLITSPAASPMNAIITSLGGREKKRTLYRLGNLSICIRLDAWKFYLRDDGKIFTNQLSVHISFNYSVTLCDYLSNWV